MNFQQSVIDVELVSCLACLLDLVSYRLSSFSPSFVVVVGGVTVDVVGVAVVVVIVVSIVLHISSEAVYRSYS